jgi:hypothetical protein
MSGVNTPSPKLPLTPLGSPALSKLAVPNATATLMLQGLAIFIFSLLHYLLAYVIRASSGTPQPGVQSGSQDVKAEPVYSIFPVENEEFVYGAWEKKVILDDQVILDMMLGLLSSNGGVHVEQIM